MNDFIENTVDIRGVKGHRPRRCAQHKRTLSSAAAVATTTTTKLKTNKTNISSRSSVPSSSMGISDRKPTSLAKQRLEKQKRSRTRPSLTEQLRNIGMKAGEITASLEKKHDISRSIVMRTSSRSFSVGKLNSKFPSPVYFDRDCCRYSFHHPFQRKVVEMRMNYRDMTDVVLDAKTRELRFKIGRRLEQFGDDYDPTHASHFIAIGFNGVVELRDVRRKIMPLISPGHRSY